jgi:regulator of protease activity HflC (stomatin/prohibitin superfamily)
MGITQWLSNLGIQAEQSARQYATRSGALPLQFPTGLTGTLIHRLPTNPQKRASLFATQQTILVSEGESAVVLLDGQAGDSLPPGRYVFEKARVTGVIDVVWIRTGEREVRWGVGNVTSADGIQISANGQLFIKVADPLAFNNEVVQGALTLAEAGLQRKLITRIQGVLRALMSRYDALSLQAEREAFTQAIVAQLSPDMTRLGLEIVGFEVVEINLPPEFKSVLQQRSLATHQGHADLINAQTQAQITQLQAAASAQAQLLQGTAQAQIYGQLQAQGIDPLKLQAMEAMKLLAQNPIQGNTVIGGDAARTGLLGQVAMAAFATPTVAAPTAPPPPQLTAAPRAPQAAIAAAPASDDPAARVAALETQLDQLTERLAMGELSEGVYLKLSARLERKIEALS